ncbi:hypothetical protein CGL52_02025 [Pyrobaculum aerophilum]|uniref:PaRep2b domain-containing protein n=3 Tax=Pyrobaculum aerophilum TaxID=13773 RepID=A0A371R6P0_9CREN|nr:hypothetical protein CGL52_02025 [Pyrobaculum aerophilum]
MTAGAVKPAVEIPAEKAPARGLIPPGYGGISAASWLAGREGRIQLDRQAAEALRRRVSKAIDKVKAKYLHKLYKLGGEALVEIAEAAAGDALNLVFNAIDSPGALRYIALLLDAAEEVLFEGRGSGDANALYGWLKGHLERAEEFNASWEVWQFVRSAVKAAAEAALSYYEDALRGIATVESALAGAAISAAGLAGYAALHDGLYSTAVVSATAAAVILAREGAFERAVEYVRRAAEAAYEAAREVFEKARITLQRLYELFVEAVARALEYVKAHWFILAAAAAGLIAWAVAQQLDYTLWQNHIALNAGAIAGLAKAAGVGEKWKEVGNAVLTRTVTEKEVVERIAQLGLDKGVVEKAVSAFSTLKHAVAKEQAKSAVLELRRLASYVQAMKADNYKKALEEASKAWYEERDPAALWALAVLGARETGRGVKVFEDENDKVAYLIASFTLLNHLREFVELKNKSYKALEGLEKAVEKGGFALSDVWDDLNVLVEAAERAREVSNELNRIAYRLEDAGYSGIAKRLKVVTENVIRLAEATQDDLRDIDATRGEMAVAALLSLVTGGLFGVSVERALAEGGKWIAGALGVVSAVRSTPFSFYSVFSSTSGGEEPSEARKLAFRIATILADPAMREILAGRQGVEVRVGERIENGKRRVYATFVENGRELLKAPWDADRGLKPLSAEGEVVELFKEVGKLAAAASSGSKPLEELDEDKWKRVVETVGRVKEAVDSAVKAITIGALPTDAVLYPGYEYVLGDSSYLSQTFTYWALAGGEISLDRVYPSEEGLKPVWRVDGKYTEMVDKVLSEGRVALENLLARNKQSEGGVDLKTTPADVKINVDLKAALADIKMNDELRKALEAAAGEFWSRVNGLFSRWKQLEEEAKEKKGEEREKVINEIDRLGKYIRVLLPLAHAVEAHRRGGLSREEAALAVIFAVLYDGTVLRDEIRLAVGGPEHEEKPLMTHDHLTAFWLWALRELGFKPNAVRKGSGVHTIAFKGDELNELLKAVTPVLPTLHKLRDALAEFADAFKAVSGEVVKKKFGIDWAYDVRNESFSKKLNEITTMAEDYVYRNITVERGPLDTSGDYPKTVIRLKLGGEEVAYINMYWTGMALQATFGGSRENAERLASIIRALGGKAEIKQEGARWVVDLYTDGITAIRHDGWLKAVRSFVDELYDRGRIGEERYKKLVRDIEAGPNTVKFAGAEFSVYYKGSKIMVKYQPTSETSKNAAVSTLRAKGLREGEHFTVTKQGVYEIRVTGESYAKAVEALAQSGLKEGEQYAVDGRRHVIRVKAEHKDAVVNALKAAGLGEGKHFATRSSGHHVIHITYDGLREIQRMALGGDMEAERFIRELEDVLRRRYGQNAVNKLIEVLTPAREEGAVDLPLEVRDEKGNVVARVVDLRYEFVKNNQPVDQCAGEDCRLRIIVEYEVEGERRQLKMEWYWKKKREKKGDATVTYYYEIAVIYLKDVVEVAVLKALTGKDVKKGNVQLYASDLDALRRFKPLKDAIDKWRKGKPK